MSGLGYRFHNLLGAPYRQGNITFAQDGFTLLTPVGARIASFNLRASTVRTLPFESNKDVDCVALSPDGRFVLTVDADGRAMLSNLQRGVVMGRISFKGRVGAVAFSPCNRYISLGVGRRVEVWRVPGLDVDAGGAVLATLELHRRFSGHHDAVRSIEWSPDGLFFLTGSDDATTKMYSLHPIADFNPLVLTGHREPIVGCHFASDGRGIYTLSKDAKLIEWRSTEDGAWSISSRHYLRGKDTAAGEGVKVTCASYHRAGSLLVVGFSTGLFGLYSLPDGANIHTLSLGGARINTVAINSTGEWLAFGSGALGQLLVWEWQSETYVLKQQGHAMQSLVALDYSPDGRLVATAGDDGKVKVWSSDSGVCFVTFDQHTGPVTAVRFPSQGHAIVTASLDGSVRAFDLMRYRNFRTMTAPTPVQFSCLAVDPAGEVVCAGSVDTYDVYVWSMQTGKILDVLSGHEGPVCTLDFSPTRPMLASGSWDGTVVMWDVFQGKGVRETLSHDGHDVLTVAFSPDGKELCTAATDGQIRFWDSERAVVTGVIEFRRDLVIGRHSKDLVTAKHQASSKQVRTLCYSADGACVLVGGDFRDVLIYSVAQRVLLRRFPISRNRSLEGIETFLNSKMLTEAGPMSLLGGQDDDDSEIEDGSEHSAKKKDVSGRTVKPVLKATQVRFSPTGHSWAAATPEGLLVYALDNAVLFDPSELDLDLTPEAVTHALGEESFAQALMMALRLNEAHIIKRAYMATPPSHISLIVRAIPLIYASRLLRFVADCLAETPHLEFALIWATELLAFHGPAWRARGVDEETMAVLRGLRRAVSTQHDALGTLCDGNVYALSYILSMPV